MGLFMYVSVWNQSWVLTYISNSGLAEVIGLNGVSNWTSASLYFLTCLGAKLSFGLKLKPRTSE